MLVQDSRDFKQDSELRSFYDRLLKRGTHWTKLPNIIEGIFLTPSHFSVGIEFADFCVGAIYRHITKKDSDYFSVIKHKFIGRYKKKGLKDGLKFWP